MISTIHFSVKTKPVVVAYRLVVILAFILLAAWAISTVEPDVAYRRGRLVLGDFGVLLIRILMAACAAYFSYFGWVLIRNCMTGELVQVSDNSLEIGSLGGVRSVKFEELSFLEAKGQKTVFRKTPEAVDLIARDRHGQRRTPRWALYGSGVSMEELGRVISMIQQRKTHAGSRTP